MRTIILKLAQFPFALICSIEKKAAKLIRICVIISLFLVADMRITTPHHTTPIRSVILALCFVLLSNFSFGQLLLNNQELHLGLNFGIPNEVGSLTFKTTSPFVNPGLNVFGLHTEQDQSPIAIGGNEVYFVQSSFPEVFNSENNNSVVGPYSKVFMPGQLRIGTMNNAWNNWKLKIVTDPTKAAFINGLHIDHRNPVGYSYGLLLTVNNDDTRAITVENSNLIGTPNQQVFRVDGSGTVFCSRLVITQPGNFPDYVFEDNYNRMSLLDLEKYIKENRHLPNVSSAKEIEDKGGYEIGEFSKLLLQKIEELTLYTIEVNKANQSMKEELELLRLRLVELERTHNK